MMALDYFYYHLTQSSGLKKAKKKNQMRCILDFHQSCISTVSI